MKSKLIPILVLVSLAAGFKVDDELELDQMLNGRSSAAFATYSKNIKATLPKGTRGKVVEVSRPFASGNQGLKILISEGPRKGQSYWVYFNKKQPALKLVDKTKKETPEPDKAANATAITDISGRRDMDEHALEETVKLVTNTVVSDVAAELNRPLSNPCPKPPVITPPMAPVQILTPPIERKIAEEAPVDPVIPPRRNEPVGAAFERVEPRNQEGCTSFPNRDGYNIINYINCQTNEVLFSGGFKFTDGPGHPYLTGASSKYPDAGTPARAIEFVSKDGALNETYVYLTDVAGGPDSHDVKSVMFIIPRKVVPKAETVGDEVHVTLTTGEKVIFDKKSNAIKSGAMKEGPIDLTTDRFKRTPPNVHYNGEGISIRVDHRFEYPTQGAATAEIRQGSRVCKVPRAKIWDKNGKLLSNSDQALLNVVNSSCPGKGFAF